MKRARKRLGLLLVLGMLTAILPVGAVAPAAAIDLHISEIHYDNAGTDTGEFVEVTGNAGTDLAGWTIELYNGSASELNVYATINLSGVIDDEDSGIGALSFAQAGIQNGAPDGLALIDPTSTVVEFLSYEGSFTPTVGAAAGMLSTDIGVSEDPAPVAGQSLQLVGADWIGPVDDSPGVLNTPPSTPLSGVGAAVPSAVPAGSSSLLTVAVTPADTGSTGITVVADLGDIGGSPTQEFVDDASNGDVVADDNIFSFAAIVDSATTDATYVLPVSIADAEGGTANADIVLSVVTLAPDIVISGVVDGPLSGGVPKAVEFYVLNDIADLSTYGFGSANNGGGTDGQEFTFPAVAAGTGTYIYVASETTGFTNFFGFAPDHTSSAASINGDDAIELFNNGSVIDTFGDINVDGNGTPWEYLDGWAYRINESGPDGTTFVLGNWTFSGPNALDGETSNATAATPFPIGTYSDVPPPALVLTGVIDGPLSGGLPKAIEFYALADIDDLSTYGFGSANNGGGTDGEEFTFPAVTAAAGDYIYVASESPEFTTFFGFAPDYTHSAANINGDDAIELFHNDVVGDVFGDINVDGNGTPWEYLDGWAYRFGATGPDRSTFVLANWYFSGPNALDGESDNATAATPFPLGTYSPDVGPTPLSGAGTATPSVVLPGETTVLTVAVTPADPPPSSGITVTGNLASIGGSDAQEFFDDGTNGDVTANDNIYSFATTIDASIDLATYALSVTIQDNQERQANASLDLFVVTFVHIYDVQGNGLTSPLEGTRVAIEGVVTADHQDGDLDGFFMQEVISDSDPATSDGIFVFEGGNAVDVSVGDVVRVEGEVDEFYDMTEITDVGGVAVSGTTSVSPTEISLPWASLDEPEQYEGMYISVPQALLITESYNFARYGEILLATELLQQPTAVYDPGSPEAAQLAEDNLLRQITLDDNRTSQNPDPAIHPNGGVFDLTNTFRAGDTLENVTGVINYSFNLYRIQPTQGADYTSTNPRPAGPDDVGGTLKVASFNVLNYFTTIDTDPYDYGPYVCGPNEDQGCRGANTAQEFDRQRAKIIAAIAAMDADIVGLMEIENYPAGGVDAPLQNLVDGLNDQMGAGTYAYVDTGPIGSDAIKVAFIYKPASVEPVGAHAVLDTQAFVNPRDAAVDRNRPALAQTFSEIANGESVTVVVNHLKSKGSECGAGDDDPEAGSCNLTRTLAAEVLADWLTTDPTNSGDPDVLIIGDLNSYDKEDPIDVLLAAGYNDLIYDLLGDYAHTYVYGGQWGYLDYAMANTPLQSAVTGTTVWHINADEPNLIDYDMTYKQDAQDALWAPDAYRASDHDPVIVGLDLAQPRVDKMAVLDSLADLLPAGDKNTTKRIERAIDNVDASLNWDWWVDDQTITNKKVFDNERQAVVQLELVVASGVPEATAAQEAIEIIVNADRQLARIAIITATNAGGDPVKLAEAEFAMSEAAAYVVAGLYNEAINAYKEAWNLATKA